MRFVVVLSKSLKTVDGGDVRHLQQLKAKEEMLVACARQLIDKEEALMSLERQLLAKQEVLYWRERCLRSEQFADGAAAAVTTDTPSMPPLIQIQPGIVGHDQPRIVGVERRRVTLMLPPDRQLQLPATYAAAAGQTIKEAQLAQIQKHVKQFPQPVIKQGQAQVEAEKTLTQLPVIRRCYTIFIYFAKDSKYTYRHTHAYYWLFLDVHSSGIYMQCFR